MYLKEEIIWLMFWFEIWDEEDEEGNRKESTQYEPVEPVIVWSIS